VNGSVMYVCACLWVGGLLNIGSCDTLSGAVCLATLGVSKYTRQNCTSLCFCVSVSHLLDRVLNIIPQDRLSRAMSEVSTVLMLRLVALRDL
jgi:hypothetical protein